MRMVDFFGDWDGVVGEEMGWLRLREWCVCMCIALCLDVGRRDPEVVVLMRRMAARLEWSIRSSKVLGVMRLSGLENVAWFE